MRRRSFLAASASLPMGAALAQAADYPNKPIKLVLPFANGGSSDVIARLIANKLSESLKQPVVVMNVPGAGGMIASQQVAAAPADGYTLFYPNASTLTIAPQLMRKQGPEPWTQFAPVAPALGFSLVLAAHPSVPANNLQELIQLAKAKPDQVSFASPGIGTTPHLEGELLKREAGIRMVHVAYKGGAPAVNDLLGGTVNLFFEQLLTLLQHFKAGKLKPLVVTSRTRMPFLPDVPTMIESGYPQLTLQSWSGFALPLHTPHEIVSLLNREVNKVLDQPDVREAIVSRGLEPMKTSSEEFGRMIREEYPRWTSIIRSQNIVSE
jgi:tripartite-type tricarboxylate transporter receptor subunit TctC